MLIIIISEVFKASYVQNIYFYVVLREVFTKTLMWGKGCEEVPPVIYTLT